jgi:hypothetical protein
MQVDKHGAGHEHILGHMTHVREPESTARAS